MSEKKLAIKLSTLEGIGDAVRSKEGSTEPIPVNALAERITALPTPSGENKFNQYFTKTLTEITAEDLEGATEIRNSAFEGFSNLTSVAMPDGLTKIGDYAFRNCVNFENVIMKSGIASIGEEAFRYCSKIKSITIPHGTTYIGAYAFSDCSSLVDVTLPDSLVYINQDCFPSAIENVYFDGDIASWCNISFCDQEANPARFAGTFYTKNANGEYEMITNLVIPNTVTEIKQYAFYYCTKIISATIAESVTSIGNNALQIGAFTNKATIRFLGTTPPKIQSKTIGNYVGKIIVPKGCADVYKSATNFSAKASIIEEETE